MLEVPCYNVPSFIRALNHKLTTIYTYGKDSTSTLATLNTLSLKLKTLLKDLRSYNLVFLRDYEKFLEEVQGQLKIRVRDSRPLERAKKM